MAKVIVALSGGVDSSVAAALLKEQGHEVEGVFMKNWSPDTIQGLSDCPWEQDQADAQAVCVHLGIPFRSINFEREYKERVVDYFLREYAAGRTPNPDVMCNKEIKFTVFLEEAKKMGADCIATGHYAQVRENEGRFRLLRGADPAKDQSYFLYTLSQEKLSRSLFPVGHLTKPQVRELAEKFGLPTAHKKDSQGICFIGHIDLKKFLMEQIEAEPGLTYLAPPYQNGQSLSGRLRGAWVVGRHQGSMFYTLGERAGAVVDNGLYKHLTHSQDIPPTYVLAKSSQNNRLYVTGNREDRHFYARELVLEEWVETGELTLPHSGSGEEGDLTLQIRYQDRQPGRIVSMGVDNGLVRLISADPLWSPAPGQSAVIYRGEEVVGGGIVKEVVQ